MKNKALFLDRDGVVNIDKHYVYKINDFIFVEGIFDLVSSAKKQNYKIIIITNQSGIGRGIFSEEQFLDLNDWMLGQFLDNSAPIDKVYFCPTHPKEGIGKYKIDDFRRKPEPGMFFEACNDYNLDFSKSIMVGDKLSDMQAAETCGIKKLYLYSNKIEYKNSLKIEKLKEVIKFL
jgi:D-glycero-D-manno-heptose 1,7-bisphosphate phosphatase